MQLCWQNAPIGAGRHVFLIAGPSFLDLGWVERIGNESEFQVTKDSDASVPESFTELPYNFRMQMMHHMMGEFSCIPFFGPMNSKPWQGANCLLQADIVPKNREKRYHTICESLGSYRQASSNLPRCPLLMTPGTTSALGGPSECTKAWSC